MTEKQRNKLIYKSALIYLKSMIPDGNASVESMDIPEKPKSIEDVYKQLLQSAQNYQGMPNVIAYRKREKSLRRILFDYDLEKIASKDEKYFYQKCRKAFKVTSADTKQNSWHKWCSAAVDGAKFLKGFSGIKDFDRFVDAFGYNAKTRMALPLVISTKVKGLGFALACDMLKEMGFTEYSKPDVHVIDICDQLGLCEPDQISAFETMVQIAKDNKVSPYQVDKVFWMICSGKYGDTKIGRNKADFIAYAKAELEKGTNK